ncbi:type IV pilus modification protein PilV [Halomonas sp. DWK9]|uniref:type IV pilus modification protein PilV n=1 Tax=Halomonadaceae TaxID=28256 RepID=UPI00287FBC67|nr:type IV pilus modification protein PilV [Halomonas sp. DWK9]
MIGPQRGFSLVEALVALVILSLGVISVAAMQLKAIQSAHSGYQQSLVSVAALDAQERVWAAVQQVERCQDIPLGVIESEWRDAWFSGAESSLIPKGNAEKSVMTRSGCQFSVSVHLDTHDEESGTSIEYPFLLPL